VPPKCQFEGIEYNVESLWGRPSEGFNFFSALKMSTNSSGNQLDPEILILIDDTLYFEKKYKNLNSVFWIGMGLDLGSETLFLSSLAVDFRTFKDLKLKIPANQSLSCRFL
jgi:hypothetical protein